MADTLDPMPWIVGWIKARESRLEKRVYPDQAPQYGQPSGKQPYCVYTVLDLDRQQAFNGPEGLAYVIVEIAIIGANRDEVTSIADKIAGTWDDPGLDGFRGLMARTGFNSLDVARIRMESGGDVTGFDKPQHGESVGTFRSERDYTIAFYESPVTPE